MIRTLSGEARGCLKTLRVDSFYPPGFPPPPLSVVVTTCRIRQPSLFLVVFGCPIETGIPSDCCSVLSLSLVVLCILACILGFGGLVWFRFGVWFLVCFGVWFGFDFGGWQGRGDLWRRLHPHPHGLARICYFRTCTCERTVVVGYNL